MSVSTEEEAQLVESLLRKEGWLMPGIPALRSQEVEPEGQKFKAGMGRQLGG